MIYYIGLYNDGLHKYRVWKIPYTNTSSSDFKLFFEKVV